MVAVSRVNPNFPIPGIDQSSKGFRDNFSSIKTEIEALQGKSIVLTGDISAGPVMIDSGVDDVILQCTVAVANAAAGGANLSIQYNNTGVIRGEPTFVYIPETGSVGIGTSTPSNTLSVYGDGYFQGNLAVTSIDDISDATIYVAGQNPTYGQLEINSTNGQLNINSINANPISVQMSYGEIARFGSTSTSGVLRLGGSSGADPSTTLDVSAFIEDIAWFKTDLPFTDSGVRITSYSNSTAGLILEQQLANAVGGIRIGLDGNVTIHSGETANAQLSSSSQRITIDPVGQVGIGSTAPRARLDINGHMRINSYIESDPPATIIATPFIAQVLDEWNMNDYRSAEYTVQVTDPATGNIDVSNILIMHANGSPYWTVYANVNNAGSLGSVSAQVDGANLELIYTPNIANVQVKLDSYYITT